MKQGTLSEQYLSNSVLKKIKKVNKDMVVGPGIGNDFSLFDGMVTAEGMATTPTLAWMKGENNFLCSLGVIKAVRIVMLLPLMVKDSQIKRYMDEFNRLSEDKGIQLAGGHTQIEEGIREPYFIVSFLGRAGEYLNSKRDVKECCDLVMISKTGLLGTQKIMEEYKEVLTGRFSVGYLSQLQLQSASFSTSKAISIIRDKKLYQDNILYIHDISEGGVYSALWQVGKWADCGFIVENKKIAIAQQTIEICEALDCNPYLLDGTGAFLMICKRGKQIVEELSKANIESGIIGKITSDKERRVMITPDDIRTLAPMSGDAFYDIKCFGE